MDRLSTILVLLSFSFSSYGAVGEPGPDLGALITEGYSQQAQSYEQMKMHPRSLAVLKSLAKTTPAPDRKIKVRLVKKRVMVASVGKEARPLLKSETNYFFSR